MTLTVRSAQQRREDVQRAAAEMGITQEFIDTLVDTFYQRVRAHPELGPIFEGAIGDAWGSHMPKMKSFWASVALNAGTYSGRPVPAHQALNNVKRAHFPIWLGLFEATLDDIAPSPEAVPYFMERARRIARSLELAMFPEETFAELHK